MVKHRSLSLLLATVIVGAFACNAVLGVDDHELAAGGLNAGDGGADGDAAATDAGIEKVGPPGCFQGTPLTDTDFFNACTTAEYLRFDNCARLGLCDGAVPPLVDPPATPASSSDAAAPTPPQVGCYDATSRSQLIFMQGSTNFTPFIQAMAPLVAQNGYVIVWQQTSSCGSAAAAGFSTAPGMNLMKNPTSAAQSYASFYAENGSATPCLLGNSPSAPAAGSEATDIAVSDIFANVCPLPAGSAPWVPGAAPYANVGHYLGPIQTMLFVTPPPSTQRAISAEAARMVFGIGGNNGVSAPWTDPSQMFIRGSSTGTNNILSRAIDVPNDEWWGIDMTTASSMQNAILTTSSTNAERTIGILSTDYADTVKDSLHILFFQAEGQLAGFLPDSAESSSDKRNVRDGHYSPWGPVHLYTKLIGGHPSTQASAFLLPFTVPNQALIDATIAGGAVPVCAMHVTRDQEMGPLKAFSPSFQCNCYYDFNVSGGTACQKCSGSADCPPSTPACNFGYCERNQ
jgi:hypothetical protein